MQDPGRGTMMLVLGILGLVCCPILAPVAWIMGKGDLAKIQAGQISKEAEQLTKIGMILGIVGTALIAIELVAGCIIGAMMAMAGAAASKQGALDVFNLVASLI